MGMFLFLGYLDFGQPYTNNLHFCIFFYKDKFCSLIITGPEMSTIFYTLYLSGVKLLREIVLLNIRHAHDSMRNTQLFWNSERLNHFLYHFQIERVKRKSLECTRIQTPDEISLIRMVISN